MARQHLCDQETSVVYQWWHRYFSLSATSCKKLQWPTDWPEVECAAPTASGWLVGGNLFPNTGGPIVICHLINKCRQITQTDCDESLYNRRRDSAGYILVIFIYKTKVSERPCHCAVTLRLFLWRSFSFKPVRFWLDYKCKQLIWISV